MGCKAKVLQDALVDKGIHNECPLCDPMVRGETGEFPGRSVASKPDGFQRSNRQRPCLKQGGR